VRYIEITEDGFFGDVVVPPRFTGSDDELSQVRNNVARSGQIGAWWPMTSGRRWCVLTCKTSIPKTGKSVSYAEVAHAT
jgi:uncharacterized protein